MKILFALGGILLLALVSCKDAAHTRNEDAGEDLVKKEELHWTYTGESGPEHWAELESRSQCGGERQSPVNIIDIQAEADPSLGPLDLHYYGEVRIHEVTNNGHTIQYNFEEGDYISLWDVRYDLKQIHFHEAAEHTLNGVRYPLEMHMVHVNAANEIAVFAIMAEEGESSEPFTFLEQYLPLNPGETKIIDASFDLNLNLPRSRDYYVYEGSFTTPPCTEGVIWIIFKEPITVSVEQVKELQRLMPLNNYRGEQPLNGRVVKRYDFPYNY
ncbi:carbonic anhydrase [Eudoraea adriatica]|uniref:carbonic anhydrase n=1 Tax=Eudoraea adriatica TaxID=446681 RepID=UPI000364C98E|nr:carbonic anhydrase family protein [Eudoraea adriatica]